MIVKWLIEHVFDDDCRRLLDSLDELGTEYKVVSSMACIDGSWKDAYPDKQCVVTYGSIQFGYLVQRQKPLWVPGHYCTNENYKCSNYYQHFDNTLLNREHIFLPFNMLSRRKEFIYETMGDDDVVFIRPDGGNKAFTGKPVYRERFEREIDMFECYDPAPDSMCLISKPKNIEKEWRFFVVDHQIICGSQYKPGRHSTEGRSIHDDGYVAYKVAHHALDGMEWAPDRAWCIDICKTKHNNYYVLEIGSFSSAGLYECHTTPLVKAINEVALDEWKEYYESD